MSEQGSAGVAGAVAGLRAALDAMFAVDWDALTGPELAEAVTVLEVQARRLPVAVIRLDAALLRSNIAGEWAMRSPAHLIQVMAGLTPRQARNRLARVDWFAERAALTGQALAPLFPAAADAAAAGEIGLEHATVIAETIEALPQQARGQHGDRVETALVEQARSTDPGRLRLLAARVVAHLDPDGPPPQEEHLQHAGRELQLRLNADGTARLTGRLTAECAAIWQTILTPLAQSRNKPPLQPESAGDELVTDQRTVPQRWHDAFEDAGRRLLGAADLPDTAGLPATLIITLSLTDLERRAGHATTAHGGRLSIRQALRLATDGRTLPVVLDDAGGVLAYGRARRLASTGQRAALIARDRGCSFPNCDRPATQSQVHHIQDWADGGPTDLTNLTITCGYHNNEAPRQGWKALMINGIPYWAPPPWHPTQTPQRNYHHHPELVPRE